MEKQVAEKAEEKSWSWLPQFEKTVNDNQALLNAQYRYKNGDETGLVQIYDLSTIVALKFINSIARSNKNVRNLDYCTRQEKASNVASYMVERYLEDPSFYISKNYPAYLYLRVQHELFYQTKASKIEQYAVSQGVDLFGCNKEEIEVIKRCCLQDI